MTAQCSRHSPKFESWSLATCVTWRSFECTAAQNPLLDSPEDLRDAQLHLRIIARICHANDGGGQTMIGGGLYPKPRIWRCGNTKILRRRAVLDIENGVRFRECRRFPMGRARRHARQLEAVHSSPLPHLTDAERIEMEHYNPKGRTTGGRNSRNDFLNGATKRSGKRNHKIIT